MAISLPRICSISVSRNAGSDWPRNTMSPVIFAERGRRPRMASELTLFPDPDSPTMPTVSFSSMSKVSESTARTSPSSVGKLTERSRTESSGPLVAPFVDSTTRPAGSMGLRSAGTSVALALGIEGVAQTVADEVHCQYREQDHDSGRIQKVRLRGPDVALGVGQHVPPRRLRWLHAEAQERQRRLGDDGGRNPEGDVEHDRP